jgi:type II secretory pathway component GspD/PulD (secretin)
MRRLLFALLLLPLAAAASPVLKSVPLHHRAPDEVVTLLRPLAPQGVSLIAGEGEVLISGEPSLVAPMVEAAQKLDKAQKALIITVREGGSGAAESQGIRAQGTVDKPEVRIYGTRDRDNPASSRQIRTLENQWARVSSGTAVPIVQQSTTTTPYGTTTQQTTQYKDVESGFEVRPRLAGKDVIVDVRSFHGNVSRQGGGMIDSASTESTVQGALGQWIEIGGTVDEQRRDEHGTLYATRSRERRMGTLQIKVEIAP